MERTLLAAHVLAVLEDKLGGNQVLSVQLAKVVYFQVIVRVSIFPVEGIGHVLFESCAVLPELAVLEVTHRLPLLAIPGPDEVGIGPRVALTHV